MKKLMFALVTAALLHVPIAKGAYIGTFTAGSFYSLEISAVANITTAVTFMSVVRSRLQIDNIITVNGSTQPTNIPVPAHADRVILLIDTRSGSALIRVNGGVPQEVAANPEARVVADVVP
jgi:nucleoid-associated protein YgaU